MPRDEEARTDLDLAATKRIMRDGLFIIALATLE